MPVRFLVISTGYNCALHAKKLFASLQGQTYKDFTAVLVDDGSTDGTRETLDECDVDDRVSVFRFDENAGAARRRWQAIHDLAEDQDPETVVCLLGMDDELFPGALERVAREYEGGAWMTYGNWMDSGGKMLPKGFLQFSDEVHAQRSYRKDIFRSTALNTFKRFLYNNMTENDFKYKGEWVRATTESNLMISCLEMCGREKIGVIEEPIYLYNRRSDNTVSRMGAEYQKAVYSDMQSRPKLLPYESI